MAERKSTVKYRLGSVRNRQFVIEEGNQWEKGSELGPFLTFPAWWRRFIFQVVTPRELTVYLYLCSVMDENAIAFPTIDQIAEDLGLTKQPVRDALRVLHRRGFLLIRNDDRRKITIYQRPAVAHTLLALLTGSKGAADEDDEEPRIDGYLVPYRGTRSDRERNFIGMSDSVVNAGLAKVLSKGAYAMYQLAREKGGPDAVLREILVTDLTNQLSAKVVAKPQPSGQAASVVLAELTPEQVAIFERFFPSEHAEAKAKHKSLGDELDDEIPF